jgi:hypothetical protein
MAHPERIDLHLVHDDMSTNKRQTSSSLKLLDIHSISRIITSYRNEGGHNMPCGRKRKRKKIKKHKLKKRRKRDRHKKKLR